ncbi:MAG TPA: 2-C-methyl-D-erythritol 2,4-cyclodiphosphate synthase [Bacteroidota bacterium]|nr:2-C-methyl-D-erythritol 2,4-cyclodiphosphate synthase [Bacteroidota bacterium]
MYRIGHGFDVHRFADDRALVLGGVEIPHDKGLLGHSDADVLLHAISDALLGAAALGDIGHHFPDTDVRYKGISSLTLLEHVGALLTGRNYAIANVDATLVMERPKIAPHVPAMRENIARALRIDVGQVSVKATTNEGLGFIGVGEGAVAHAVALITSQTT